MAEVVADLFERQSVGEQLRCARVAQRVRPEVSGLYPKGAQPPGDDVVDGWSLNGGSRRLGPDKDLSMRHIRPNVIDVSPKCFRHGRYERINLGLATLESPDVQKPGDRVDLLKTKRCNLASPKAIYSQ